MKSTIETHYLLGLKELKIQQDSDYLPFSLDSILLADFFTVKKRMQSILDLGTGAGPIPLYLTTKTPLKITGIDIQEPLIKLAKRNAKINQLEAQLTFHHADIKKLDRHFENHSFDAVIVNPPFFKKHEKSPLNELETKQIMRHEMKVTWEDIVHASARVLRKHGTLSLIHRIDRLIEVIDTLNQYQFTPKRMRLVYPKIGKPATSFLMEAWLDASPGLTVESPLIVHDENSAYTKEINTIFHREED